MKKTLLSMALDIFIGMLDEKLMEELINRLLDFCFGIGFVFTPVKLLKCLTDSLTNLFALKKSSLSAGSDIFSVNTGSTLPS